MRRAPETETKYPWGDEIKLNGKAMANCHGCGSQWDGKQTAPVGSFPANAFRSLRYGRQRLGVDGGLLERELPGRAGRRLGMDERRLRAPRPPRRFLVRLSRRSPLGGPRRGTTVLRVIVLGFRVARTLSDGAEAAAATPETR